METLHTIAEHVEHVLARVRPTPPVELPVAECAAAEPGLVLSSPVVAAAPVPAFDHAAVDGYAVALSEVPAPAPPRPPSTTAVVVRAVRAGDAAGAALLPGQAARVMTGAPVPVGTDVVVPVERTSTGRFVPGHDGDETSVTLDLPRRDNIRRRGEDVEAGAVLAGPGDPVTPALIAAAAAAGVSRLTVHRRPTVAVLSTGSELRPAGTATPGSVVDSNSPMLTAIARAAGAHVLPRGGIPDDAAALRRTLDDVVAAGADLIVTTGGVSAGAWDVVRQLLLEGTRSDAPRDGGRERPSAVDLTGVAMRPGRPQGLASWRGIPWIALPGTPTAAFTSAHLFVRPAVDRLRGSAHPGHRPLPLLLAPAASPPPVILRGESAANGGAGSPGLGYMGGDEILRSAARPQDDGMGTPRPQDDGMGTPRPQDDGMGTPPQGWTSPSARTRVLPVAVDLPRRTATPLATGGHAISALLRADGLALVPPDAVDGTPVDVLLLGGPS